MEKLAYSVAEAAEALGIGQTAIRDAIRDNRLVARYSGTKILLPTPELERWRDSLPTDPPGKTR